MYFFSVKKINLIISILLIVNFYLFILLLDAGDVEKAVYFLDVGQGDSQLVDIAGAQILIDGGKGRAVVYELAKILPKQDKYIDLMILSHAQLDHYGGFIEAAKNYNIGVFIYNGQDGESGGLQSLKELLKKKGTPIVNLKMGDNISHKKFIFDVLAPDNQLLKNKNLNESGLVLKLSAFGRRVLFTGDIGLVAEKYLLDKVDLTADILKVGHHGSKNSSSAEFLTAVNPIVNIIGVGQNNYGHPHPYALKRLRLTGGTVYRTDKEGTMKIILNE